MSNCFARQFGYDQLYVGNPNAQLAFSGNLFEGARAWYYSVTGGTAALFSLPLKVPNCHTSLSFCTWYSQVSKMPGYLLEHLCIGSINAAYEEKLAANKRSRGIKEYQSAQREVKGETRGLPRTAASREQPARRG